MHRRQLLAAAPALALPACQPPRPRIAAATAACLPPVRVSPERVIRTVAGLRPFRPTGFRVEREALGDKALVHNYGHGGAGITLSWGTSRLAVDLGLAGHQGPVAVLGAGVMGLTTARLVQEAGFPITLYTAALPPDTTSNIAGGQIHAFGHFDRDAVTPAWRDQAQRAEEYSWRRWQIMVGDDYGVHWVPTYVESRGTSPGPHMPGWEKLDAKAWPFGTSQLIRYDTMYVETGRMLRELTRDVHIAGGRIAVRRFATPADVAALPERLVFNCTGLGAGALFGDTGIHPVRGQLAILIPQPEIHYAYNGSAGYMFPRADGILLGGTQERDIYDATPQPEDIARILASHQKLFAGFRC
ncbi:MAG: FAD-dependent oxidoreductase [Sphingomonas sp.]|uniref:FAD-dependent oxidoreductase n=1 Tax=Sphingomonas sp. TaxID=28214 RepID=UPI0025FC005D|nr:FAD-dependent oxidoreductase [Sphingomonas sp.]MBX3566098.1 FAD-dependent oxidoreductase [Sphingomonas sp.]